MVNSMNILRIILLVLLSTTAYADGHTVHPIDFKSIEGSWKSARVSVPGEKQTLVFQKDKVTKFIRVLKEHGTLSYESKPEDFQMEEDIIILKYHTEEFGLTYKMVLSGWHVEESGVKASKLYGMLFLYQDGKQYNGFPVSFIRK
jgi:hypothetical protein